MSVDQHKNSALAPEAQEALSAPDFLTIKVTDNHNEIRFKIGKSTRLEKLMSAFCDRIGKNLCTTRFFFDGKRILPDHTANGLEMDNGDTIEVFYEQKGGSRCV